MNETLLRRYLDNPARHWGVIALILAVGVTVILPGVDRYNSARQDCARLRTRIDQMRHDVAGLEEARRAASEKRARLGRLESSTVATDKIHLFRQEMVDWARKSGCQVRRIRVGSPRTRPWYEGEDPLEPPTTKPRKAESPYVLTMCQLSVSASGTLPSVKGLLARLGSSGRLAQGRSLALNPSRENRKQVVMDLELLLFDLTTTENLPGQ